jgi:predicted RNA binding protein YcfA (HicA-like mRNA interferase family)
LRREGFRIQRQKGSHETWAHPLLGDTVQLAGHDGADAQPYQERQVRAIIEQARQTKRP